ncbi:hypothetical protein B0H17DRAFT_1138981 [Mycena rosella]|uniref:Secreted protein n=1 Tax=Mycena rosella TaxID=1033263 RepID=A0AAD7GBS1_MYCRO|nr:hypothetical protein B0H17DRAFT_1138981 [Mycena rosella]
MALITPVIGVSLALPGCSALLLCARGPSTRPGGFVFLSRGSSMCTGAGGRNEYRFAACIGGNCGLRASLGIHLVTKTAPAPIGTVLRLRPDKPGVHAAHQIIAKINSLHAASGQDCLREKLWRRNRGYSSPRELEPNGLIMVCGNIRTRPRAVSCPVCDQDTARMERVPPGCRYDRAFLRGALNVQGWEEGQGANLG